MTLVKISRWECVKSVFSQPPKNANWEVLHKRNGKVKKEISNQIRVIYLSIFTSKKTRFNLNWISILLNLIIITQAKPINMITFWDVIMLTELTSLVTSFKSCGFHDNHLSSSLVTVFAWRRCKKLSDNSEWSSFKVSSCNERWKWKDYIYIFMPLVSKIPDYFVISLRSEYLWKIHLLLSDREHRIRYYLAWYCGHWTVGPAPPYVIHHWLCINEMLKLGFSIRNRKVTHFLIFP